MNRAACSLLGAAEVQITGAWPEQCLDKFARAGIFMDRFEKENEMVLCLRILKPDCKKAALLAKKCGCEMKICSMTGFAARYYGLRKRILLIAGLLCMVAAAIVLPEFIWSIDVSGNEMVSDTEILRALESLGVGFGTYGPSIDSQDVKNHMLALVPELQWLAVNRSGGKAVVEVREKLPTPEVNDRKMPCNLVARRTGLITKMLVYQGKSEVKQGQTVLQGELLVSGIAQWTNRVQSMHAMAEIYARTWRRETGAVPMGFTAKGPIQREEKIVTLILGKKRLKLTGNSSFSASNCAKIIQEYPLCLPGGLTLPVRMETVTLSYYTPETTQISPATAKQLATQGVQKRIRDVLIGGEISDLRVQQRADGAVYYYDIVAECSEQIAAEVPMEIDEGEPWQNGLLTQNASSS